MRQIHGTQEAAPVRLYEAPSDFSRQNQCLSPPYAHSLFSDFLLSTFHIMLQHRSVWLVLVAPPIRLLTLCILEVLHVETRALEPVRFRLESDQPRGDCSSLSFSRRWCRESLVNNCRSSGQKGACEIHLTDMNACLETLLPVGTTCQIKTDPEVKRNEGLS